MKTDRHIVWATSLWFVAAAATASAGTWYVSTNGNDSTGADWDNAYTEVQTALDAASDGDTIYLAGHTFELFAQSVPTWTNANLTVIGGFAATNVLDQPGVSDPEQWPTVITAGNLRTMWMSGADDATLQNVRLTGGGIQSGGNLRINDSTNVELIGCVIDDCVRSASAHNVDFNGGGIWIDSVSSVTMIDCLVKNNFMNNERATGSGRGAGIWSEGNLIIQDSQILNNRTTDHGGGIYIAGGTLAMTNVLLAGNTTLLPSGGGLYVANGTVRLDNCTLADNAREGIYQSGGSLVINNSIVWGNWQDVESVSGDLTITYSNVGDTDFGGNNLNVDPLFEYGYYLAVGSPCTNAGSDTATALGMASYARNTAGDTYDPTETINLGYHYPTGFDRPYADIYVATGGDDGNSGTNALQPFATMTHALAMARAGSRINVATGTYSTATGETFPLTLPSEPGIQILGSESGDTIFDASGNARVITVQSADRAVLRRLTLTGGSRTLPTTIDGVEMLYDGDGVLGGAGVLVYLSQNVEIDDCRIESNGYDVADGGNHTVGGGIAVVEGALTVTESRIQDNYVENTRGNYTWGGGVFNNGKLTILNTLLSGNGVTDPYGKSDGGGLTSVGAWSEPIVIMRNVLFTGNVADRGDGIFIGDGEAEIVNCTVADNNGEGVRHDGGTVAVTNSILWNNGIDSTGTVTIAYSVISNSTDYVDGGNNQAANPLFVDASGGNYRLQRGSPAIDTGFNQPWMASATDLDGMPRVMKGIVDRGCYEITPPPGSLVLFK